VSGSDAWQVHGSRVVEFTQLHECQRVCQTQTVLLLPGDAVVFNARQWVVHTRVVGGLGSVAHEGILAI
jgi:hypothetical protein